MRLVCFQPALGLEKSSWTRISGERRHAGCHSTENTRLCVCVLSHSDEFLGYREMERYLTTNLTMLITETLFSNRHVKM